MMGTILLLVDYWAGPADGAQCLLQLPTPEAVSDDVRCLLQNSRDGPEAFLRVPYLADQRTYWYDLWVDGKLRYWLVLHGAVAPSSWKPVKYDTPLDNAS